MKNWADYAAIIDTGKNEIRFSPSDNPFPYALRRINDSLYLERLPVEDELARKTRLAKRKRGALPNLIPEGFADTKGWMFDLSIAADDVEKAWNAIAPYLQAQGVASISVAPPPYPNLWNTYRYSAYERDHAGLATKDDDLFLKEDPRVQSRLIDFIENPKAGRMISLGFYESIDGQKQLKQQWMEMLKHVEVLLQEAGVKPGLKSFLGKPIEGLQYTTKYCNKSALDQFDLLTHPEKDPFSQEAIEAERIELEEAKAKKKAPKPTAETADSVVHKRNEQPPMISPVTSLYTG